MRSHAGRELLPGTLRNASRLHIRPMPVRSRPRLRSAVRSSGASYATAVRDKIAPRHERLPRREMCLRYREARAHDRDFPEDAPET